MGVPWYLVPPHLKDQPVDWSLPANACPDCAVDWSDLDGPDYFSQRADGTWVPELGIAVLPEPDQPQVSLQLTHWPASDGTPVAVWAVLVDKAVVGLIDHVGPRKFAALLVDEGGDISGDAGVFAAGRWAWRTIVQRATGKRREVNGSRGYRLAEYHDFSLRGVR